MNKTIYHRNTLMKKYDVTRNLPASWNNPTDGNNLGYNAYTKSNGNMVSWYTEEFTACCGGILVHTYNMHNIENKKEEDLLAKFMTEFMHNVMKRMQRPLCIGILTSAKWQNALSFKKAGWKIPKGIQSDKHETTTGPLSETTIRNILHPAYLFQKDKKTYKLSSTLEEEEYMACNEYNDEEGDDYDN